jgi:hypothetical protein
MVWGFIEKGKLFRYMVDLNQDRFSYELNETSSLKQQLHIIYNIIHLVTNAVLSN